MPRDTGGRAKDGHHSCRKCGCYLPQKVGKPGRRRLYCDACNPHKGTLLKCCAKCVECGDPVEQTPGRGRVLRYCSRHCRNSASKRRDENHSLNCDRCGKLFFGAIGTLFCSSRCRWPLRLSDPVQCAECGASFVRKVHSSRYCTEKCASAAKERNIRNNAERSRARAVTYNCLCCNKPFRKKTSGRTEGKYCTRECAFEARRLRLPCAAVTRRTGVSLEGQLAVWFHSWGSDADDPKNVGCRRGGHKHRCRRYGCHYESFSSRSILERDGWVCQWCGCKLQKMRDKSAPWKPTPDYPTIDHIVPLSFGPSSPGHRPSNVQACCWSCNIKKRNSHPDSFAAQLPTSPY